MTTTIRIRKSEAGPWLPVTLLEQRPGWVQVADGHGPLWVMVDQVHPDDIRGLFSACSNYLPVPAPPPTPSTPTRPASPKG